MVGESFVEKSNNYGKKEKRMKHQVLRLILVQQVQGKCYNAKIFTPTRRKDS